MDIVDTALHAAIRRVAFRRLLRSGSAVPLRDLAADLGLAEEEIGAVMRDLSERGAIRVDGGGRVTGAAGLSVGPDRHRMELGRRTLWTWCAYDFMGIFGALRASGAGLSRDPLSGAHVVVDFESGQPRPSAAVLFRPDERMRALCTNTYEQWCPNSNVFERAGNAREWARERSLDGRILTLEGATAQATGQWEPLVEGLDL